MGEPGKIGNLADQLEQLRPRLSAFVSKKTRNRADAEEITQQTMLIAFQNLERFRGDCPLSHWAFRIAAHACTRYYRRLGSKETSIDDLPENLVPAAQQQRSEESPDAVDRNLWLQRVIEVAQEACTPTEFRVMMMMYQTGSLDEAGTLLKMNGATVRSHFLRGRANLMAKLILEAPDLIGGKLELDAAIGKAQNDQEGFSKAEQEALASPDKRSKAYRSACLKIARHLPNPF